MKTLILALASVLFFAVISSAADYNISINSFTYSPSMLTIQQGDNVTISASSFHPLVQVSRETWNANGNTPVAGGWGSKTSDYLFTATVSDTIYYVCGNHANSGMKGKIVVQNTASLDLTFFDRKNNFQIFPNPAKNYVTINYNQTSITGEYMVILTDILGREKYRSLIKDNNLVFEITGKKSDEILFVTIFDSNSKIVAVKKLVLEN